jgi:rSAM/selenodomain-associated transferase 1
MTKVPMEGMVKTRLVEEIGERHATEIYKLFILDTLKTLEKIGVHVIVYYTPEDKLDVLKGVTGDGYEYIPQKGEDLGERLFNGFRIAKGRAFEYAAALATDVPDVPRRILEDCIDRMYEHEVVLGPCPDGGYYLIGLRLDKNDEHFFQGINWGTKTVLSETIERMKETDLHLCEPWEDVDSLEGLSRLWQSETAAKTRVYLEENMKRPG